MESLELVLTLCARITELMALYSSNNFFSLALSIALVLNNEWKTKIQILTCVFLARNLSRLWYFSSQGFI